MPQIPYPIRGIIKMNIRSGGADVFTAQQGAIVYARDITEGTFKYSKRNVSIVYTNSIGEYIIDVANITSSYSNGDTIRVYCKLGGRYDFFDMTLNTGIGFIVQNFNFTHKS